MADALLGLIELAHQRFDELSRAILAERVGQAPFEQGERRARVLDADLVEHAMRVKPALERPVHAAEQLLHFLAREQVVELGPPVEQRAQSAASLWPDEFAQKLAQRGKLGPREPLREQALSELDGSRRFEREKFVEDLIEVRPLLDRIDDHACDRFSELRSVVEADFAGRPRRIDGLRRRNREALAPEGPEEVVEDGQHAGAILAAFRRRGDGAKLRRARRARFGFRTGRRHRRDARRRVLPLR